MEREFNKLVRDYIPDKIESNGEVAVTRVLNDVEYKDELYKKLLEEANEVVEKIRAEFEPKGVKVFPLSTLTGKGLKELLYYVSTNLEELGEKPVVYDQEYDPEVELKTVNEAFTVEYDSKEHEYVVEGPKIEKMLGYTNLDSEKGFAFFQNFLAENGILDRLEELGIQEGDTVRMYGLAFDYYRNADTKSPDDMDDDFYPEDMDDSDFDDSDFEE